MRHPGVARLLGSLEALLKSASKLGPHRGRVGPEPPRQLIPMLPQRSLDEWCIGVTATLSKRSGRPGRRDSRSHRNMRLLHGTSKNHSDEMDACDLDPVLLEVERQRSGPQRVKLLDRSVECWATSNPKSDDLAACQPAKQVGGQGAPCISNSSARRRRWPESRRSVVQTIRIPSQHSCRPDAWAGGRRNGVPNLLSERRVTPLQGGFAQREFFRLVGHSDPGIRHARVGPGGTAYCDGCRDRKPSAP